MVRGEGLAGYHVPLADHAVINRHLAFMGPGHGASNTIPQRACVVATNFRVIVSQLARLALESISLAEVPVGPRDFHASARVFGITKSYSTAKTESSVGRMPLLNVTVLMGGKVEVTAISAVAS